MYDEDMGEVITKLKLKIGYHYKVFYGKGNLNNHTIHIRGIIDGQYVLAKWRKTKGYFRYYVESPYYFYLNADRISSLGKSRCSFEEEDSE